MKKQVFIKHRDTFFRDMKDNSFALFYAGEAPHKTTDQRYPFTINRNFFYLTGIERERFVLVMAKAGDTQKALLFIEEPSDYATKWLGERMTKEEASRLSGVDEKDIFFVESFRKTLHDKILSDSRAAVVSLPDTVYLDLYRYDVNKKAPALERFGDILGDYPEMKLKNANPLLARMRMVKSDQEIEAIRRAVRYTKTGIEAIWQNAKPGINERQLDALFEYTVKLRGSEGVGFDTIVASGEHATVLHYVDNNQPVGADDLILLDLGAMSGPYSADVSRTFPANGTFTERQRAVYDVVLSVNKQTIAKAKPGVKVSELNAFAKTKLAEGLIDLGVIDDKEEVSDYYYHSVSHYLGLDVHDVGTYQVPLEPGMVITVEPGLYIKEEGIGIRIEDDVLITESGHENLTEAIIKEADAIETFMS